MEQTIARTASRPEPRAHGKGMATWIAAGVGLLAIGGGIAWYLGSGARKGHATEAAAAEGGAPEKTTRVTVAEPTPHGIEKVVDQPGTVDAFEWADLHAKVSGYLKTQGVDIGSPVTKNQVLAEIEVPELVKARDQAVAALDQARAAVAQAAARVKTAQALRRTALSTVATAKSELERRGSSREYREKQFARIRGLVERRAVEGQLEDEEKDRYDAAVADEHAAQAGVQVADAQVAEAEAKIEQAEADLAEARANIEVAQAALEKAGVLVGYTKIVSPYDGVVTMRAFHPGAFVRSASDGNDVALLSVARTDKVRVVVRVPDTFVPYVDVGDPATVRIANLPGREFRGTVSRFASREDVENRTMRTEIDLPNPGGLLRAGMYGNVSIVVHPASRNLTIPASALFEQSEGKGFVYVVRDGKARKLPVTIAEDNGVLAEIVRGISPGDRVITKYNGAIADGVPVQVDAAQTTRPEKAAH